MTGLHSVIRDTKADFKQYQVHEFLNRNRLEERLLNSTENSASRQTFPTSKLYTFVLR